MSRDVVMLLNLGGGETVRVHKLPQAGETAMTLERFHSADAGRGPNAAIAMARLGAAVSFVGKCGRDAAGARGEEWMTQAGVDTSGLLKSDQIATGQGVRVVADDGQSFTVGGLSASRALTEEEAFRQLERLAPAKFFCTGFEIRHVLALAAAQKAKSLGMKTVLNYSPVPPATDGVLDFIDYLVLDGAEAAAVLGLENWRQCPGATLAERLLEKFGCGCAVITLGTEGCVGMRGTRYWEVSGEKVEVADMSGAGDAFLAALTVCLASGMEVEAAALWANRYAACTTTVRGVIPSFPDRRAVKDYFKRRGWEDAL